MKLKDLESDPFAKTVIKRSSSDEREVHLLRVHERLTAERDRVGEIGRKIAQDLTDKGVAFQASDPRFLDGEGEVLRVGMLDGWNVFALSKDMPPKLVAFCRARNDRHSYLNRQIEQVQRNLKGIRGAQTRRERKERYKR